MNRWKNLDKKKKIFLIAGIAAIVLLFLTAMIFMVLSGKEEVVYEEAKAEYQSLQEGISSDGSVSVGTSDMTFDLDISQYTQGESDFSWEGEISQPAGGMMGEAGMGGSSQTASASSARTLMIEEVLVSVGEEIQEGTPLFRLSEESVTAIREELEQDLSDAQLDYEKQSTQQALTLTEAELEKKTNQLYGQYAELSYQQSVEQLQEEVDAKQEEIAENQESLTQLQQELSEAQESLLNNEEVLENARYAKDNTDKENDLYNWLVALNSWEDASAVKEDLESEIESLTEQIEELTDTIETAQLELESLNKELETGTVTAEAEKDTRLYQSSNTDEIYSYTVESANLQASQAQDVWEDAREKLDEFDSYIVNREICADTSGIVTEVLKEEGDSISGEDILLTLSDYGNTTIVLTMDETDMENVAVGTKVNITLDAYEDQVFTGSVTEIGDASMNSDTNTTTYEVTVTFDEGSAGFYEGMTAEVTFLNEESEKEVLCVPKRAVTQREGKSYVLVKEEDGSMQEREVTTGISDGVFVEITQGIEEGETVFLASKA